MEEQDGVKAPGREKRTTFLSAHSVHIVSIQTFRIVCTWNARAHHVHVKASIELIGKLTLVGIVWDWHSTDLEAIDFWGVWDVGEGRALWEVVADLDRHFDDCCEV